MAYPIHGKVTRIAKNDVEVENEIEFTLDFNLDLDEISAKGDDWKKWLAGQSEWGGTMNYNLDPTNAEQITIIGTLLAATPGTVLTDVVFRLEDSGDYFSGDIVITNFSSPAGIGGKVIGNLNFKGKSAPSLTIT
jgi:hypothetical protein